MSTNGTYRVVAQFSSGDAGDWATALRNVSNLFHDGTVPTGRGDVTFVVNGHGVRFLAASVPESGQVRRMVDAGVRVAACENSLERFDLPPGALVDGVETVGSGVAEAVRLQNAGNAYLKLP